MQVEEKQPGLTNQDHRVALAHLKANVLAVFSVALGAAVSLSMAFIGASPKSVIDLGTGQRIVYFSGGLLTLAMIIVQVATLLRHRNRDVIQLKKRLADIYSAALRQSALNPQLESPTPHDRF